jgi:hypothetical protein
MRGSYIHVCLSRPQGDYLLIESVAAWARGSVVGKQAASGRAAFSTAAIH